MSGAPKIKGIFQDALNSAFSEVWSDVLAELKDGVYATLGGFDFCEVRIVDNCAGTDWLRTKLSDLVARFLEDRDGAVGHEELDWCEAIAADMEKQAARIRKHAAKLRKEIKK